MFWVQRISVLLRQAVVDAGLKKKDYNCIVQTVDGGLPINYGTAT